jgi:hypothetical protein
VPCCLSAARFYLKTMTIRVGTRSYIFSSRISVDLKYQLHLSVGFMRVNLFHPTNLTGRNLFGSMMFMKTLLFWNRSSVSSWFAYFISYYQTIPSIYQNVSIMFVGMYIIMEIPDCLNLLFLIYLQASALEFHITSVPLWFQHVLFS